MVGPYEASELATRTIRKRSPRRIAGWSFGVASVVVAMVLLLNLLGCNLYLYINVGANDLVFGGACGVFHNAIASHAITVDMESEPLTQWIGTIPGYWHLDLLNRGPFHLFVESPGELFQPLRFDSSWSEDYVAVEFPLLCLIAVFGLLAWLLLRRPRLA